jgi:putative FmdB family regulatory protein
MPLYEFECREHGVFELERRMAEASDAASCGVCGHDAARIVSLPNLAQVPRWKAKAREVNERSQHAPRLVTR